jgi:hypothetical protein
VKDYKKVAKEQVKLQAQKFKEEVSSIRDKLEQILVDYPGLSVSKLKIYYYDNSDDDDERYTFRVSHIEFKIFSRKKPIPTSNYNETGLIEFTFWSSGISEATIFSKSKTPFEVEQEDMVYKKKSKVQLLLAFKKVISYAIEVNKERFK